MGGSIDGRGGLEETISAVVTSPPYSETLRAAPGAREKKAKRYASGEFVARRPDVFSSKTNVGAEAMFNPDYGEAPGQLGRMPEGDQAVVVAGIVTSPPFGQDVEPHRAKPMEEWEGTEKWGGPHSVVRAQGYGSAEGQIGALPVGSHEEAVDAVVTSPPYEKAQSGGGIMNEGYQSPLRPDLPPDQISKRTYAEPVVGEARGQISQEQGATYWSSVAQIYQECWKVLRPGGICCVVVKDFVRQKKRILLVDQTLELLIAVGFEPLERIRAWFISPATQKSLMPEVVEDYTKKKSSFFRKLAERKGSPRIDFEEVLFLRKT